MKTLAYFLIVIAVIPSCQENDSTTLTPGDYFVSAQRNDVDWIGTPSIRIDDDTLTFFGIANHPDDEVIVIRTKFNGIGTYSLTKNQAYYYTTIGGDVLTSEYGFAPDAAGEIVVSKYDQAARVIEGNFELTLTKLRSNPPTNNSIVNFAEGTFKGVILD